MVLLFPLFLVLVKYKDIQESDTRPLQPSCSEKPLRLLCHFLNSNSIVLWCSIGVEDQSCSEFVWFDYKLAKPCWLNWSMIMLILITDVYGCKKQIVIFKYTTDIQHSNCSYQYLPSINIVVYITVSFRLMQGWLFSHNTEYWKPPQVKALLTSVPKVFLP